VAGDIVGVSARFGGRVLEWAKRCRSRDGRSYRCLGSLSV